MKLKSLFTRIKKGGKNTIEAASIMATVGGIFTAVGKAGEVLCDELERRQAIVRETRLEEKSDADWVRTKRKEEETTQTIVEANLLTKL